MISLCWLGLLCYGQGKIAKAIEIGIVNIKSNNDISGGLVRADWAGGRAEFVALAELAGWLCWMDPCPVWTD